MTVKGQTRSKIQLSLVCAIQDSDTNGGVTSTVVQHAAGCSFLRVGRAKTTLSNTL